MKRYLNLNGISWVLDGDTDRAMSVRPLAQKMMHVMKMQNVNNLDHVWYTHRMEDGTVIRVESLFGRDKAYVYCDPPVYAPKKRLIKKTVRRFVPGICLSTTDSTDREDGYQEGLFYKYADYAEGSFGNIFVFGNMNWAGKICTIEGTKFSKPFYSSTRYYEEPPFYSDDNMGCDLYSCKDWGYKSAKFFYTLSGETTHDDSGEPPAPPTIPSESELTGCDYYWTGLGSHAPVDEERAIVPENYVYYSDAWCKGPNDPEGCGACTEYTTTTCLGEYTCKKEEWVEYHCWVECGELGGYITNIIVTKNKVIKSYDPWCYMGWWPGDISVVYSPSIIATHTYGVPASRTIYSTATGVYTITAKDGLYPYATMNRDSGNIVITPNTCWRNQIFDYFGEQTAPCTRRSTWDYTLDYSSPDSVGNYAVSYINANCTIESLRDKYIALYEARGEVYRITRETDSFNGQYEGCTCTLNGVCSFEGTASHTYPAAKLYACVNGESALVAEGYTSDDMFYVNDTHVFDADGIPVYMYSYTMFHYNDEGSAYNADHTRYGYFYGSINNHYQSEKFLPAGIMDDEGEGISMLHDVYGSAAEGRYGWGGCAGYMVEEEIEVEVYE